MKRYVIGLLASLFTFMGVTFALNWTVDPFGYNGTEIVDYDRRLVSFELGRNAYKISRFRQWDGETAFFGDSTVNMIDPEKVAPELAATTFNFGVGGQTLFDTIDAVRYAIERQPLKRVYIGVPFRHYDDRSNARVFTDIAASLGSPLRANLAYSTTKASIAALAHVSGIRRKKPRPDDAQAKPKVMDSRLQGMRSKYAARAEPQKMTAAFTTLVCELEARDIAVTLFTPPSSLAARAEAIAHPDAYRDFKGWVRGLGLHIDYDTGEGLAADMDSFYDHNHVKPDTGRALILDLLSDEPALGRVSEGTPEC